VVTTPVRFYGREEGGEGEDQATLKRGRGGGVFVRFNTAEWPPVLDERK
jgi:hypothetical protein